MSTWLEIRCEERKEAVSIDDRCWSDDNAGPMDMAGDDNNSVLAVMKELRASARKSGWVRKSIGWVCPACAER